MSRLLLTVSRRRFLFIALAGALVVMIALNLQTGLCIMIAAADSGSTSDNAAGDPGAGAVIAPVRPDCEVTNTPTNTPTSTPTNTPTDTPTNTTTDTPTETPTNTPTDTPTNTPTDTPTYTPTNTPTETPTNTPTDTPTNTPTRTRPPRKTPTPTFTPYTPPTDPPTTVPTVTPTSTFKPRPRINTPVPTPRCTRFCPDWLLYHANMTHDWEIYRLDGPDAYTNVSQGVGEGWEDIEPSRSPDSQWAVFASNRTGNWELFVARTAGSELVQLTFNAQARDVDPNWGPDDLIAFETSRDGNWEIYLFDIVTGAEVRLTDHAASDVNAYWMPDGHSLVFESDRDGTWQIYRVDIETKVVTLLSDGIGDDRDPVVSPDGEWIAFNSTRNGEPEALSLMNTDGTDIRRFTAPSARVMNPAWSPEGSLIAYESDLDGDLDIYVYQPSTGLSRQLTDNDVADYAPTWRCSDYVLVFTSDVTGDPNLFEASVLPIDAPGIDVWTDANQLTTPITDDVYPVDTQAEEDASREGRVPSTDGICHTFVSTCEGYPTFPQVEMLELTPDTTLTRPDPWKPIGVVPQCR